MKKVVIIHPVDFISIQFGGIESLMADIVELLPSDVDVYVISTALKSSPYKILRWNIIEFRGKKINFLPILKISKIKPVIPLVLKFSLGLMFLKFCIDFRNAIVIYNRIEPALILTRKKSLKEILIIHGDIRNLKSNFSDNKWKKFFWIYSFLEARVIKKMEKIFVVSISGLEYYKKKYPSYSERFHFMPSWPNVKIFKKLDVEKETILAKYGIDRNPILLYVGRLENPKNPKLLISSFSIVAKYYPNSGLIIVGEGTMRGELEKYVKEIGLQQNIFFLGYRSQPEVSELMNASDVFVLTSVFEGMPVVVLEALCCGLPVVSTNVGEVKLVIKNGESGAVVDSEDPKAIAEAIIKIIENRPSPDLCIKSISKYTPDVVLNMFFALIGVKGE
jgi:glycosyltransferase involved in cell wall biosynthesis